MQAIHVQNSGKNSTLTIGKSPTPQPQANEVQVRIQATAINRADLNQRAGHYPPPEGATDIIGLEMAGIVDKVGANASRWQSGDEVMGLLPGGGYAQYCSIHEDMLMAMPEKLSFVQAAAVPETFLTAFQALCWLGELQADETVLIHAAGSGVGTSAIQLANELIDAQIVGTAGKARKLETAQELGADFTYNYKSQNYAEKIIEDIGENSISLIIDFIGGPYWHKNMEVLDMDGRVVYLSFLGGHQIENLSLAPILKKRLSIMGSTLRSRVPEYKIDLTRDFWDQCGPLFAQQKLRPVIDSTFDWEETEKAHQRMEENKNTGKIVLMGM